jgi:hypothetical protein
MICFLVRLRIEKPGDNTRCSASNQNSSAALSTILMSVPGRDGGRLASI